MSLFPLRTKAEIEDLKRKAAQASLLDHRTYDTYITLCLGILTTLSWLYELDAPYPLDKALDSTDSEEEE